MAEQFPKIGDEGIPKSVVNMSGKRSNKTTPVKKTGNAKGGSAEAATASHRSGKQERLGAKLHPQVTRFPQNASEAGKTQKNMRMMPSRVRSSDSFYDSRRAAGA